MTDATAALEAAVMAAGPDDAPHISPMLAEAAADPGGDYAEAEALPSDLIGPEVWRDQWGALHDMAGGMVQMRSGAPCPLGDQARSAGGIMAADAAYALMASTPFLADLFLSAKSTFMGQLFAIGMHGFACVQMVKASNAGAGAE